MTPQVIVTLGPDGGLIAELPGANGSRRQVPLSRDTTSISCEATLLRMLKAQLTGAIAIGTEGAPTGHQVRHWERHTLFRDPSCPFCKVELDRAQRQRHSHRPIPVGDGSVTVRRLARRGTAKNTSTELEDIM